MAAAFEQPGVTGRDVVEFAAAGLLAQRAAGRLGPSVRWMSTGVARAARG
jgi:hypothetical protein